ncbi:10395_t:CDS:1, partial [Dentiscutata erythropus]
NYAGYTNYGFEEAVAINKENIEEGSELSQQIKLICKAKSDV